ncbi:hypothetical protein B0H14DRAFT_2796714 [Mycena olivaceomarginata]|nr:hypothetical protein B0H14DRAFT_2796714 [Mycena olivaceomarginata]
MNELNACGSAFDAANGREGFGPRSERRGAVVAGNQTMRRLCLDSRSLEITDSRHAFTQRRFRTVPSHEQNAFVGTQENLEAGMVVDVEGGGRQMSPDIYVLQGFRPWTSGYSVRRAFGDTGVGRRRGWTGTTSTSTKDGRQRLQFQLRLESILATGIEERSRLDEKFIDNVQSCSVVEQEQCSVLA